LRSLNRHGLPAIGKLKARAWWARSRGR
jgi:hypothetical protein